MVSASPFAPSCRYKEEEAPACSDQLGAAICEDYKVTQGCSRGELSVRIDRRAGAGHVAVPSPGCAAMCRRS